MRSSYITVIDNPEKNLFFIFNALSGALLFFNSSIKQSVLDMLDSQDWELENQGQGQKELYDLFKKTESVIESSDHELQLIRNRRQAYVSNNDRTNTLNVSIATTLRCNLNCSYCYQTKYRSLRRPEIDMTDETMERIIGFIKERSDSETKISVGWYGGEPLMCMNVIEKISAELIKFAGDKYRGSGMATNGTLLSKKP